MAETFKIIDVPDELFFKEEVFDYISHYIAILRERKLGPLETEYVPVECFLPNV